MRTRRIRWFLWLVSLAVVLLVASFVAGAVLAEGALHPLLRRRASDTEALAYCISQSVSAKAQKVGLQTNHGVRLSAWWLVPERSNGNAVVVCHGVADSAYGSLGYALLFLKNGYSVLVPESRVMVRVLDS